MQIGSLIGRYEIREKIGEGGMGEVYLAEDTKLDRHVALKVLLAEVAKDEARVKRFVQEAKAASALNHPNILTVFEIGVYEGSHYIATELIKGRTLRDRMRAGDLGLTEALGIGLQAAAALGAAHEAGIIHRDIKPENIMIRDDGLVKVLDFGLAKLTEKRVETAEPEDATRAQLNTEPGLVMGTVAYMSPEQARGRSLDARSDIFSLGIVLYELFTGKRPFDGESNVDLISSILKDDPPSLKQLAPELPRQLERIVDKTLRKDREHRYQHVKDLEIDLADLRDELKFEAKLNKTVDQGMPAHNTSSGEQRPTLTESISATRRFTLLHAIVFVAAAAAVFGAILYFGLKLRTPDAVRGDLRATELASWTSAPGELFSSASFSPDGKLIAFSSTRSGTKNIWVTQSTSTEAIQVTSDSFSNKDPIWSPKGDEIAFLSDRGNVAGGRTNATGVWRVSALGGAPKSVGPVDDGSMELRRWIATGKIYYQSQGELYALEASTGQSQKVTSFDPQKGKITWVSISEDEKTIAYVREKEDAWQLFTSDPADSRPVLITEGSGGISGIVWLPEKELFHYSARVDGVFQVFRYAGSGTPVRITSSESDSVVVDISSNGKSIIISSAKEESSLWRVGLTEGQESPISRSINSDLWPSVSPDGERVVYQSSKNLNRGNNLHTSSIQVRSLKVRDERPTVITESGFLPAWSPDGSAIAFLKRSDDAFDLVTANPNGGSERKLSGSIPTVGYSVSPYNHVQTAAFSWAPNSASIAFVSKKNGSANLWSVSLNDGSERALTNNSDPMVSFYCPIWSGDGKKIAFSQEIQNQEPGGKPVRGLLVLDVETGTVANIFTAQRTFRLIGWSEDNSSLIIAESSREFSGLPPETKLIRISVPQGKETEVARLKNAYYYNIFLSDDRKLIAYAAHVEGRDDLWYMPAAGDIPRKLTNNNDSGLFCSRLAWLRDGRTIVFGKQIRFSLLSIISDLD